MASGIFVLTDRNALVAMRPTPFNTEAEFQKLLAAFPMLLSGDDGLLCRWLLITREKAIRDSEAPDAAAGPISLSGRWSIDHLFIDQDGIPTLVEVKRQSDTRLRREVVGQMLDYAANGMAYWSADELRLAFEERCLAEGRDKDEEIRTCLGIDDPPALWLRVKTNLQAGRIRLLFVADEVPPELRRIVAFLNQQMDPAEVLALELRHYTGEGLKTIVPTLIGQTEETQAKKGPIRAVRSWDEASIYAEIESRFGSEQAATARAIGNWMKAHADRVGFGRGATSGSMRAAFIAGKEEFGPLNLWTYGKVEIPFQSLRKPPFDDPARRLALIERLTAIRGADLAARDIELNPAIPLTLLATTEARAALFEAMAWFAAELHRASSPADGALPATAATP